MLELNFDKMEGYIIAVVQCARTNEVLNAGLMSEKSMRLSIASESVVFSSRGRDQPWMNTRSRWWGFSDIAHILVDCDQDTLLFRLNPRVATCTKHFGSLSCFHLAASQIDFDKLARRTCHCRYPRR